MTTPLSVLLLTSPDQAASWLEALRQAGYAAEATCYDSLEALRQHAGPRNWQLVLSRDSFPISDVSQAIRSLPLVIIASQPSVEAAVASLKGGAGFYLAGDKLADLGAAVEQTLAESARHDSHEITRKQDEIRSRQMFENISAIKLLIDPATGAIVDGNDAACRFYGYNRAVLTTMNIAEINMLSPQEIKAEMDKAESDQRLYFEFRHRLASGAVRDVEVRSSPLQLDGKRLLYSVIHDITERKLMEKAQSFMVTVGHILNATLDYRTVLKEVARSSVPFLADVCLVFLVEPDDSVILQTQAAIEKEIEAPFVDWFTRHPAQLTNDYGVARAINTGTYQLIKPLEIAGKQPLELEFYRELKLNSALVVPLLSQGKNQGALAFIYRESGRVYTEIDLRLADGLARRVGLAIDNARHYEEARQAAAAEMATRQQLEVLAGQLTHQAEELNAIIEAMPDGVFITDANGELIQINPRGREIVGFNDTEDPLVQFSRLKMFYPNGHDPVKPEDRPLAQALRGQISTEFREMFYHPVTGKPVQVRVSFAPIRKAGGEIRGAVAVVSDVTELQRLENQKDEFLTIASHELKTPITSIKGLTQLAIRRLNAGGHTREVASLRSVEKQVDRLIELISDMLDTRRVQHNRLELHIRPFDLAALVRETGQALQTTTTQHSITVEAPPVLLVQGDAHRIEQVLNNLLTNAIKYSPKGGTVEVKLEQRDGSAYVSVRDHGIGVPAADRQNLFQPFHRASNVSLYEVAGFGLGLYLCSEIMKAHHGRLWLEDAADSDPASAEEVWDGQAANSGVTPLESGSIFCFSLPIENPPD